MTEAKAVETRIHSYGPGKAFTAADFSDIASQRNAGNILGRMHARGVISRAMRGVYYLPEHSELLDVDVPVSTDQVAHAIARANKWVICPAGDTALNSLGLDTQVPAKLSYVSSGPYKSYEYEPYTIEFKHRANRDLLGCSETTCAVIQALKALGKDNISSPIIETLARNLSEEQVGTLVKESAGLTSWVTETAKKIRETQDGQNSEGIR